MNTGVVAEEGEAAIALPQILACPQIFFQKN